MRQRVVRSTTTCNLLTSSLPVTNCCNTFVCRNDSSVENARGQQFYFAKRAFGQCLPCERDSLPLSSEGWALLVEHRPDLRDLRLLRCGRCRWESWEDRCPPKRRIEFDFIIWNTSPSHGVQLNSPKCHLAQLNSI